MSLRIIANRLSEWPLPPEFEARVVRAASKALLVDGPRDGEVSLTFVRSPEIRSLHRDYLGHDRPTDVIAFDLGEADILMADIYICPDEAARNAADRDEDVQVELLRLVIHGSLHVIGYDHPDGPDREASRMYTLQEELLAALADG